ncbi:efflux RND transporter periplasmic adaptor subunit [Terriglobus tenax]|uniref:efflux RND transporter periplasmic adaptor subunit n=1 Tax=Terriglobus tenax TaxID=1111115 RepID=UPI0021DF9715|nr:efflux RND transporter periplasmic adaptor subunit [Terriglobus tenax]
MNRKSLLSLWAVMLVPALGCHSKSENATASQQGSVTGMQAASEPKASVPADSIKIARQDQSRAGIQVASVTVRSVPQVLTVSGQVILDEKHTNHIGALADGRIENVSVLPGDPVRRGQTMANLHSHTVHETVAALTQAFASAARQKSAVSYAEQVRDRYTKLYSIQAASLEEKQKSEQDLASAQRDLISANATVQAEREHLAEILQVSPEWLQPNNLLEKELVPVRAVADGVVITRNITPGQVVTTGDELFATSNLSTVWVSAAVSEKDVAKMHVGSKAIVTMQASANVQLPGTVAMIGDLVDPQTRTLPVRIQVANPGTQLRPGMFVSSAISEPEVRNAIFVPQNALQDVNGFRVVFVTPDGVSFHAAPVTVGTKSDDLVEITDGLKPGDKVVTNGAFMVKGELLKGSVGD